MFHQPLLGIAAAGEVMQPESRRANSQRAAAAVAPQIQNGGSLLVRARLIDLFGNQNLSAKSVHFFVNDSVVSAMTNADGSAEVTVQYSATAFTGLLRGTFAGNDRIKTKSHFFD